MAQIDLLNAAVATLNADVTALSVDQPAAFTKLQGSITALQKTLTEANQTQAILLVSGVAAAPLGTIALPVTLIPGTFAPVSVQADFSIPTSMSFVSEVLGPIPTGEGKGLQAAMVGSLLRVIVFGINQTVITDGLDFTINLKTTLKGQFQILMQNVIATDANGNNIPICFTSGIATVQ